MLRRLRSQQSRSTVQCSSLYCAINTAGTNVPAVMPGRQKVLYYGLFFKMVPKSVPLTFVNILMYWYSRLHCAVLWKSVLCESFSIQCGVRQGGVLSPYLFSLYIDDIIRTARMSGYGIYVGSIFAGCILYADDILLLSSSYSGLQEMVNICYDYGLCLGH